MREHHGADEFADDADEIEPTKVDDDSVKRFGRFELCFELAAGGMATVYLARMSGPGGFGKLVALKRIHPHLAKQKKFIDMFLDEARIASRVTHPNVCSVVDFGEANGSYYLAMDYLVGESLSGVLRYAAKTDDEVLRRRLPLIAARVVSDAAEGLHAAHEVRGDDGKLLNIVHRDVSPQNIFVTYEGGVNIVDFGIATASDRGAFTTAGTIKGKYAYVSPEQVRSEQVDRRADVWSLGVVLWELLTRRRLFRRNSEAETLLAVTNAEIPPPSTICPEAPPELDAVVLKALSRDRAERYGTAREMSREILRAVAKTGEMVSMGDVAELMGMAFVGGEDRKRQLVAIATSPGRVPKIHTRDADSLTGQEPSSSVVRTVPPRARDRAQALPWVIVGVLLTALVTVAIFLATRTDTEREPVATASVAARDPTARGAGSSIRGVDPSTEPSTARARPTPTPVATIAVAPTMAETPTPTPTPTVAPTVAPTPTPTPTPTATTNTAPTTSRSSRTRTSTSMDTSSTMRTPSTTEPTHASAATGTVNVVTPGGWAEVWWRGRRVGQTPGRVVISAGRQQLELRPFGRTPGQAVHVTVPADGTTRVSFDLR